MSAKRDYFGFSELVSLILAIFIPTAWILGVLTRFKEGKYVATIIRVFLGFNIIWVLDLIFMVMDKQIFRFLDM